MTFRETQPKIWDSLSINLHFVRLCHVQKGLRWNDSFKRFVLPKTAKSIKDSMAIFDTLFEEFPRMCNDLLWTILCSKAFYGHGRNDLRREKQGAGWHVPAGKFYHSIIFVLQVLMYSNLILRGRTHRWNDSLLNTLYPKETMRFNPQCSEFNNRNPARLRRK